MKGIDTINNLATIFQHQVNKHLKKCNGDDFFLFNMSCKKVSYTIVLWFDISFMCVQLFVCVGEGQFTSIKRMSYNQTQVHIEHYKFSQQSKEKSIKKYLSKGMINHKI
jgi:hypothetical protein